MISSSVSLLTDQDLFLFNEGTHYRLYEKLGAHSVTAEGRRGTYFAVWAPNARDVSVAGPFNGWRKGATPLRARGSSGIWEAYLPGVESGTLYKYLVTSRGGEVMEKSDPFAFHGEIPPKTASVVWDLDYDWRDQEWMSARGRRNALDAPFLVYELHVGSWMRLAREGNRSLGYRELAERLADYVQKMGFTHVEFLPVMEHPFFGSWGYQTTGYFQPSSRYGTPQDFMYCVDHLHQRGIGVILDWVPSHFPTDAHSLALFDGTHLFEHEDPKEGFHPDWRSYIFNYGRHEVRSFLLSSALFWLDRYHADGLRVDAVASMLYRDYSRKAGEWVPNKYGGRENLEVIDFLRQFNTAVYQNYPDVQTVAEESTAWPMVSRPTYVGGLGFGMKWDMGWMHDTLDYMGREPIHRKYHHDRLTFRMLYAFTENYMLPLSHDEVVYGKGSLWSRMPGDDWQKRPTSGCSSATCTPSRARSCSSWEESSASQASGTTTATWTGTHSSRPCIRACSAGSRISTACSAPSRRSTRPTSRPPVSAGSTATTRSRASSPCCAGDGRTTAPWSQPSTSPPCRATTTASGCRTAASGASCSTATPGTTAAAARETWAASSPRRCPGTGIRTH